MMADSEEDCDTWRNRDKYPKEREPSEKKASLSPVDQKRSFNSISPNKSVEPPFKRQKNDDFGAPNSNRRGSNENKRDHFDRKDSFDNRKDNFDNRKDNFDSRKDNFENRNNSFDSRNNNFENRNNNFENRNNNFESRNNNFDSRKDNFENKRGGFENRRGNFDNRRGDFDNRRDNFERKDNFDNRRDSFDNRRDSFDSRRENHENTRPANTIVRTTEELPNYPTQPQMLLFKHFLQQQEDNIEMDTAMVKYNEYKENFVKKQLKAFFDAHNAQEWFREKYLSSFAEFNKARDAKNIVLRKEIFTYLLEHQWMDTIKLHVDESDNIVRLMDAVVILLEGGNEKDLKILDSKRYRSESPNDIRVKVCNEIEEVDVLTSDDTEEHKENVVEVQREDVDDELREVEAEEHKKVVTEEQKKDIADEVCINISSIEIEESRPLHKTFSIFLRNLHPNVLRSEIEALVKPYPGFLRLALQDPTPDRKFFRRGWVTYDRTVNIKEICWNLNNIRLHDCDIGAIVNRELTQRVRPVNVLANHKPVMRQDIKFAAKLIVKFDKRHNLWQRASNTETSNPLMSENPLMENITEYLVDEGSYEEEALLGGNLNCNLELTSSGADPLNITIDNDEKATALVDKLILYLRFVHSYDYYSNTEYQIEDEMPHRCGIIHARGAHILPDRAITQKDVEEYIKTIETKAEVVLNTSDALSIDDAKKLGYRDVEIVEETFIITNTQELAPDKWLCPLSGKKFKGPDFVRKHILNKHLDKVEEVKQLAAFFNNYLIDSKRPQLPEHPMNRPGAKVENDGNVFESKSTGNDMNTRGRGDMYRGAGRRNDDFDRPRNNYRGSSPGENNKDFGGRNNFDNRGGNDGNYYRKSNFSSRGGNQGRQRNGGSYYSRNMTSYNDLDAPMDD